MSRSLRSRKWNDDNGAVAVGVADDVVVGVVVGGAGVEVFGATIEHDSKAWADNCCRGPCLAAEAVESTRWMLSTRSTWTWTRTMTTKIRRASRSVAVCWPLSLSSRSSESDLFSFCCFCCCCCLALDYSRPVS